MALAAVALVCNIMLNGTDVHIVPTLVILVLLFFVSGYVDPSLSEERELQRKLRDMETRDQAEEGTLGLDSTGRGYIALNFFNVFWIFVVCSVSHLIIEGGISLRPSLFPASTKIARACCSGRSHPSTAWAQCS